MPKLSRAVAAPLRRFFNPRFDALAGQLAEVKGEVERLNAAVAARPMTPLEEDRLLQAEQLERVDVSDLNHGRTAPTFNGWQSRAASAAQCEDPVYRRWFDLLEDPAGAVPPATGTRDDDRSAPLYSRKVWEWACIAEAAEHAGVLQPGRRALGFGVGSEPLPALLASRGLDVLATDQELASGQDWAQTNQHMSGLTDLSRPHLLPDEELAERVSTRAVDMNDVPDDLGTYDLIWSACCLEHLGTPELGLRFVERTCSLLTPGGVAVHTTELELIPRSSTADYGHCAVYRGVDLAGLHERVTAGGLEMELNLYVTLDTPQDRWISLVLNPNAITLVDRAHLKLVIGDSVSTSFALVIRRPA